MPSSCLKPKIDRLSATWIHSLVLRIAKLSRKRMAGANLGPSRYQAHYKIQLFEWMQHMLRLSLAARYAMMIHDIFLRPNGGRTTAPSSPPRSSSPAKQKNRSHICDKCDDEKEITFGELQKSWKMLIVCCLEPTSVVSDPLCHCLWLICLLVICLLCLVWWLCLAGGKMTERTESVLDCAGNNIEQDLWIPNIPYCVERFRWF